MIRLNRVILARQTGFSEADLELFLEALKSGFELDRSAARGLMSCQRLMLYEHNSELGNAPAHKLFESVKIAKRSELPRSFADYEVIVEHDRISPGVSLEVLAA